MKIGGVSLLSKMYCFNKSDEARKETTNNNIWLWYGYGMDMLWLLYGYGMDMVWLLYGYRMDMVI